MKQSTLREVSPLELAMLAATINPTLCCFDPQEAVDKAVELFVKCKIEIAECDRVTREANIRRVDQ